MSEKETFESSCVVRGGEGGEGRGGEEGEGGEKGF